MLTKVEKEKFLVPDEKATIMIEACANNIFQATTVSDVLREISKSEAVAATVRAIRASELVVRDAELLMVRAERRLGEISKSLPKGSFGPQQLSVPLDKIKEAQRLVREEGLSQNEAGRRMGIPQSSVRYYINMNVEERKNHVPKPKKGDVLKENGISIARASTAERLASVPDKRFEASLAKVVTPKLGTVVRDLGIQERRPHPKRAYFNFTEDLMNYVRSCCKNKTVPTRSDIQGFERRLAALNTE